MNNIDIKSKKVTNKRLFEIVLSNTMINNLKYFVQQELQYYNTVSELLTSRAKAFPSDVLNIKDREVKLLETCAQYGISPEKLIKTPLSEWKDPFKSYEPILRNTDKTSKLSNRQIEIMNIGACPGHLPSSVRRSIVSEIFSHVSSQASILLAGQSTEHLRIPLQMLQQHTLETKRHLQLGKAAIKMNWDENKEETSIITPYGKESLVVKKYDLTSIPFNSVVIRAPYKGQENQTWLIELKEPSKYMLTLTDNYPYRKKRNKKDNNPDNIKH